MRDYQTWNVSDMIHDLNRRVAELERGARGQGRPAWEQVAPPDGFTVRDGAHCGWRMLSDGRVELRGQIVPESGSITSGTVVLRLPNCPAPPLESAPRVILPCSAAGGNPGVVRADVRGVGDVGRVAEIVAYPPEVAPLQGWIGFDHVVFDPCLYLDVMPLQPQQQALRADGGEPEDVLKKYATDSLGFVGVRQSAQVVGRRASAGVATLECASPHGFAVGQVVAVQLAEKSDDPVEWAGVFNGLREITSIPDPLSFCYPTGSPVEVPQGEVTAVASENVEVSGTDQWRATLPGVEGYAPEERVPPMWEPWEPPPEFAA